MNNLKVKTSKMTGYKNLEAEKVKKAIDALGREIEKLKDYQRRQIIEKQWSIMDKKWWEFWR